MTSILRVVIDPEGPHMAQYDRRSEPRGAFCGGAGGGDSHLGAYQNAARREIIEFYESVA